MNSMRRLFALVPRGIAMTWLVAHFGLTLLYCFPVNPIKLVAEPLLNKTIGAYFAQNWSLFAPNPIATNQALLVQCLDQAEFDTIEAGAAPRSEDWRDITTPLLRRHQENRFSAYDRLSRTQTNFMRQFMGGDASVEPLVRACQTGDKDACQAGDQILGAARVRAAAPLVKVASSYCRDADMNRKTVRVLLRIRSVPVKPWSQRMSEGAAPPTDTEVGSYPVDETVPSTGLFSRDG